jgi:hypothetical protein
LNDNQKSELEIPHKYNINRTVDDEKILNPNSFELSCLSEKLLLFAYYKNKRTEDHTELI